MSAWTWNTYLKCFIHRNPKIIFFCIQFGYSLFGLEMIYMDFAVSKFRFI